MADVAFQVLENACSARMFEGRWEAVTAQSCTPGVSSLFGRIAPRPAEASQQH